MKRIYMMIKNQFLILCACIILLIVGFILGFYLGDNINNIVVHPFKNTSGIFDYSILWTAFLGLGTLSLSIVVAINSAKYQKQTEKLTTINLELTDKLVHIETFKYFPQLKGLHLTESEIEEMEFEKYFEK